MSEKKKNNRKNGRATPEGKTGGAKLGSPMDVGLLQQIVKLMSANDLNTVDVRDGDKRVILKRGAAPVATYSHTAAMAHAPAPSIAPASSPAVTTTAAPSSAEDPEANYTPIKSPMVGTYYSSSSPDAKPFVSVGTQVDEETDVCIIEAMKVFNNIKAECRGTIAKILITNGQPVEFGQTLFLVKPA